jgi:DNA polymerase III delta prime subunit
MRWYEAHRPKSLADVLGQPAVRALEQFACEPFPNAIILEGDSGTGKTATAMLLADMLSQTDWFGASSYKVEGVKADALKKYFDKDETPFRFRVSDGKFHVLRIEELEYLHHDVQNVLKESIEEAQRRYRVIFIATSNDSSGLTKAMRHRFKPYYFSAGETFAAAINDWLPSVWEAEVGPGIEMPYGFDTFGWDGDAFSARLALDRLEAFIEAHKHAEVAA